MVTIQVGELLAKRGILDYILLIIFLHLYCHFHTYTQLNFIHDINVENTTKSVLNMARSDWMGVTTVGLNITKACRRAALCESAYYR